MDANERGKFFATPSSRAGEMTTRPRFSGLNLSHSPMAGRFYDEARRRRGQGITLCHAQDSVGRELKTGERHEGPSPFVSTSDLGVCYVTDKELIAFN